ncbi:MAG: nuclear transport factor 2 family protein [Erythrobacter sp.]|uniref:nuclear transport factor 2 family protein n=1 Tax=Erythrobacter sp. TaxID=1042 RepID=UPI0032660490
MNRIQAELEVDETRLMRAWMNRDPDEVRSMMARDCLMMFGTQPPALLDRPSFLAGLDRGLVCKGFRFHEASARKYGANAWYSAQVDLELQVGANDWSGTFLLTDLWRRARIRRNWQLAERSVAPTDPNNKLCDAIRSLQLWR